MSLYEWEGEVFGRDWKIEILGDGSPDDLHVKQWPELSFAELPQEKEAGIFPRRLRVPIIDKEGSRGYVSERLFDETLLVELSLNDSLFFKGKSYSESRRKRIERQEFDTEFIVSDGLNDIQGIDYDGQTRTFNAFLRHVLYETGIELPIYLFTDWDEDNAMGDLPDVHRVTFGTEDDTLFTALEKFCRTFGFQVYQEAGAWHVVQVDYFSDSSLTRYVIETNGNVSSGAFNPSETLEMPYNPSDEDALKGYARARTLFPFPVLEGDLVNGEFEAFEDGVFAGWDMQGAVTQENMSGILTARHDNNADKLIQPIRRILKSGDRWRMTARAWISVTNRGGQEDAEWLEIIFRDLRTGQRYWLQNDSTVTGTQAFLSNELFLNGWDETPVLQNHNVLITPTAGFPLFFSGAVEVRTNFDDKYDYVEDAFTRFDIRDISVAFEINTERNSRLVASANIGTGQSKDIEIEFSQNNEQHAGYDIEAFDGSEWVPAQEWGGLSLTEKRARDFLRVRDKVQRVLDIETEIEYFSGFTALYTYNSRVYKPIHASISLNGDVRAVLVQHERTEASISLSEIFDNRGVFRNTSVTGSGTGGGTTTGAVTSVFGRDGDVVAQEGDYASFYGRLASANTWTLTQIITRPDNNNTFITLNSGQTSSDLRMLYRTDLANFSQGFQFRGSGINPIESSNIWIGVTDTASHNTKIGADGIAVGNTYQPGSGSIRATGNAILPNATFGADNALTGALGDTRYAGLANANTWTATNVFQGSLRLDSSQTSSDLRMLYRTDLANFSQGFQFRGSGINPIESSNIWIGVTDTASHNTKIGADGIAVGNTYQPGSGSIRATGNAILPNATFGDDNALTGALGDTRYGGLASANTWTAENVFQGLLRLDSGQTSSSDLRILYRTDLANFSQGFQFRGSGINPIATSNIWIGFMDAASNNTKIGAYGIAVGNTSQPGPGSIRATGNAILPNATFGADNALTGALGDTRYSGLANANTWTGENVFQDSLRVEGSVPEYVEITQGGTGTLIRGFDGSDLKWIIRNYTIDGNQAEFNLGRVAVNNSVFGNHFMAKRGSGHVDLSPLGNNSEVGFAITTESGVASHDSSNRFEVRTGDRIISPATTGTGLWDLGSTSRSWRDLHLSRDIFARDITARHITNNLIRPKGDDSTGEAIIIRQQNNSDASGSGSLGNSGTLIKGIDLRYTASSQDELVGRIGFYNENPIGTGWYAFEERMRTSIRFFVSEEQGSLLESLRLLDDRSARFFGDLRANGNFNFANQRIRTNLENNEEARIEVWDDTGSSELIAMGYLTGLTSNQTGNPFPSGTYGVWVEEGERMVIDGDVEYEGGDWIIDKNAEIIIGRNLTTGSPRRSVSLGRLPSGFGHTGERGLFLYDGTTDNNVIGKITETEALLSGWEIQDGRLYSLQNDVHMALGNGSGAFPWETSIIGFQAGSDTSNRLWLGEINGEFELAIRVDGTYLVRIGTIFNEIANLDIAGTLMMSSSGEITNANDDYSITEDGFNIAQSGPFFNRERAYTITDGFNNVRGGIWGSATLVSFEAHQRSLILSAWTGGSFSSPGTLQGQLGLSTSGEVYLIAGTNVRIWSGPNDVIHLNGTRTQVQTRFRTIPMTEAARNLLTGKEPGDMIYNSTTGRYNYWTGSQWKNF